MNVRASLGLAITLSGVMLAACASTPPDDHDVAEESVQSADGMAILEDPRFEIDYASPARIGKLRRIRDAARARGIQKTAYLLAGIANVESTLVQCWSEATWACKGPSSADCGGGPVIAGRFDGDCSLQEGGLGMFQFDAGTYSQTLAKYGTSILGIEGQLNAAVDYVVRMVRDSIYTTNAETDAKARAWIASFDAGDAVRRDQWIKTVVRYYNGCQPQWSCWSSRIQKYSEGLTQAIDEPGGLSFWAQTTCPGSPGTTIGAIDARYQALGGCGSVLGAPLTNELTTSDGVGRYNVFENGVIFWTPQTNAHEVHGRIRARWAQLGAEGGYLGYPISGQYVFGAGQRSDFQGGSLIWHQASDIVTELGR